MVKDIDEAGEKKLKVVFEKKRPGYIEKDAYLEKKAKTQIQKKMMILNNNLSLKMQEKKIDVIRAELNKARGRKKRRIQNIGMAVQMANQRENLVTDKFLQDVETLVTRFKSDLDKMQELFGNILQKLPQLQLDVAVTTC